MTTEQAEPKTRYAVLVYQNGIANVFSVECLNMRSFGREAKRLLQADFRQCEAFARGMAAAGCVVASAWCDQPGDITDAVWKHHDWNEAPFSENIRPVFIGVANPDSLTVQVADETYYVF